MTGNGRSSLRLSCRSYAIPFEAWRFSVLGRSAGTAPGLDRPRGRGSSTTGNSTVAKGNNRDMRAPTKYVEKGLTMFAGRAFDTIQFFNRYRPNPGFTPKWSDKPLQKSWQK